MNYFEIFNITVAFEIDLKNLKQVYLKLSRLYHPDFSTQDSEEIQEENLRMSALVNEAYKVLENEDLRLEYILSINNLLDETENRKLLPQSFLFEMMELNEELQDLKLSNSNSEISLFKEKLNIYSNSLKNELVEFSNKNVQPVIDNNNLNHWLLYYLKKRYLKRLYQQIES
jgi:molecular chaperone HscB